MHESYWHRTWLSYLQNLVVEQSLGRACFGMCSEAQQRQFHWPASWTAAVPMGASTDIAALAKRKHVLVHNAAAAEALYAIAASLCR
jgi:hypothetical protein